MKQSPIVEERLLARAFRLSLVIVVGESLKCEFWESWRLAPRARRCRQLHLRKPATIFSNCVPAVFKKKSAATFTCPAFCMGCKFRRICLAKSAYHLLNRYPGDKQSTSIWMFMSDVALAAALKKGIAIEQNRFFTAEQSHSLFGVFAMTFPCPTPR
jgi:hypothetical protein